MAVRGRSLNAVLVAFLVIAPTSARAETIRASDVLQVTFNLEGGPPGHFDFGNLDYFEFVVFIGAEEPISSFTTHLYDGDRLLGTYSSPFSSLAISRFISETSPYAGDATVVDFTAFNNGSLAGRIEFTIATGSGVLHRISDELSVGRTLEPFIATTSNIYPTSFEIVPGDTPAVPEPATMVLAATGLGIAGFCRRLRRRSGSATP